MDKNTRMLEITINTWDTAKIARDLFSDLKKRMFFLNEMVL